MTRLEALEAVAAAARESGHCGHLIWKDDPYGSEFSASGRVGRWTTCRDRTDGTLCGGCRIANALAALDQTAPQPPGADPQPHRGSVVDTAGIFAGGPDSVEWLAEQRGVPMIPDLLAQAYGADALVALDRLEASTHDASGGPPAPHRRPSEEVGR